MKLEAIAARTCNLCAELMIGGIPGFVQHGEQHHSDHFLVGGDTGTNIHFSEKKYWCPIDQSWHSNRKWLARALGKLGWTNEQYYLEYGEIHMPDVWLENTSDPVLADAHNHDRCLQCAKTVKFTKGKWLYPAFCGFSCATTWYAENTDRPTRAMHTLKERQKTDPTLRLTPTQIDYWTVKKGLSLAEAKEKVRERQSTNTLERFIARAGGDVEQGEQRWAARQEKWLDSLGGRGWFGNHSDVSKRLFTAVQQQVIWELRFGERELSAKVGRRVFKLDCSIQGTKKAIEFFGDYWHANPNKYSEMDTVRRLDEGRFITAKEIWMRDKIRLDLLRKHGFQVLVVWEADFVKEPDTITTQCVTFLNN